MSVRKPEDFLALPDLSPPGVVTRFEEAWKRGERPEIDLYLAAAEGDRQVLLIELIAVDLERRLEISEAVRVEHYLRRYPDLAEDRALLLELLLAEYGLRQRNEPHLSLDEFRSRFPLCYADLLNRLQAHTQVPTGQTLPLASPAGTAAGAPPRPDPGAFAFLAPPVEVEELGRLANYRVLRLLGQGGMGIVFHAEDVHLQRPVALKVMKPEMARDLGARQRFLREARAMAAIKHEAIVTVYHVGQDQDVPFLAMELLCGESLEDRIRRETQLASVDVLRIGREIASGLAAAHRNGLIHRDIKPSNLWLEGPEARAKILDFGLARVVREDLRLTPSGMTVGTPAYMAPEQAVGKDVDARCDLFSLGCVLYEMCTGQLPFRGTETTAVLLAVALADPIAPRHLNPTIPPVLDALILHLFAKDPLHRPDSAAGVVELLDAAETVSFPGTSSRDPGLATVYAPVPLPSRGRPVLTGDSIATRECRQMDIENRVYLSQLRLLLEEVSCDICRFEHVTRHGLAPEAIRIDREFPLAVSGAFADIRVVAPGQPPYVVEIKYGYSAGELVQSLHRKYGTVAPALAERLVLVIDAQSRQDWSALERRLVEVLPPTLQLEVWDESRFTGLLGSCFGLSIDTITEDSLLDTRQAIDRAKGFHAFGAASFAAYEHDPLRAQLLWHFGFWRLRELREGRRLAARQILPPGRYEAVVVLVAGLSGFASYVRATRADEVIRDSLTSFYSKARYQVLNRGGMVYQCADDRVIGLFGIPDHRPHYVGDALETAKALRPIGVSVCRHWQRHLDRVQETGGLRIGLALGDLQIVALRPFSRTHVGVTGDPLQAAAKLLVTAGPSEIAVSNPLYQCLREEERSGFREAQPIDPQNTVRMRGWKLSPDG